MHKKLIDFLCCPSCGEENFSVSIFSIMQDDIYEGTVTCQSCNLWFRVENGILDFLPLDLRRNDRYDAFVKKHSLSYQPGVTKSAEDADQKNRQIDFFKKDYDQYEKCIVNMKFFKALNFLTFDKWVESNAACFNKPVLEVGCGTGRQSIVLCQKGIQSIGIDLSEEMLIVGKRKSDTGNYSQFIDFIIADAENPPLKDSTFSACVMVSILHHLPNPAYTVFQCSKKTVSGGLFYIIEPNKSPLRGIFDLSMRIWKLWDEEASDDPLIKKDLLEHWLNDAEIQFDIHYSTYVPPHIFGFLKDGSCLSLLKTTDSFFNRISFIKKFGGIIIAEGTKKQ